MHGANMTYSVDGNPPVSLFSLLPATGDRDGNACRRKGVLPIAVAYTLLGHGG